MTVQQYLFHGKPIDKTTLNKKKTFQYVMHISEIIHIFAIRVQLRCRKPISVNV